VLRPQRPQIWAVFDRGAYAGGSLMPVAILRSISSSPAALRSADRSTAPMSITAARQVLATAFPDGAATPQFWRASDVLALGAPLTFFAQHVEPSPDIADGQLVRPLLTESWDDVQAYMHGVGLGRLGFERCPDHLIKPVGQILREFWVPWLRPAERHGQEGNHPRLLRRGGDRGLDRAPAYKQTRPPSGSASQLRATPNRGGQSQRS
jgi:hypothetical protein